MIAINLKFVMENEGRGQEPMGARMGQEMGNQSNVEHVPG